MRLVDFGQTLKRYRARHKLTQEKMGELLGVQTKHISFLENGQRNPSPELQKKLEEMLMADELEEGFLKREKLMSPEEINVLIRLNQKLSKIAPVQREKAVELICQILDMMGKA